MITVRPFAWACVLCAVAAYAADTSVSFSELRSRIFALTTETQLLEQQVADWRGDGSAEALYKQAELQTYLATLEHKLAQLQSELAAQQPPDDALADRNGAIFATHRESPDPIAAGMLDNPGDVNISGFMDAVYQSSAPADNGSNTYLNQVEVDFAKQLNNRADATLGVIYDEGFQVGVAQINYAAKTDDPANPELLKTWTLSAGQFDAPFGEDVAYYPSNVRQSVSIPAVVAYTHNQWNDLGIASQWQTAALGADLWLLRGFALQSHSAIEEPTDDLHVSAGTRLNYQLAQPIRIGVSGAAGWLSDESPAMQIAGAHAVLTAGSWTLLSEALILHEDVHGTHLDVRGGYAQLVQTFGAAFGLARADYVQYGSEDPLRGLSAGLGLRAVEGIELRSEYRVTNELPSGELLLQVVATF